MRIFLGTKEVAGYNTGLKKGFEILGIPVVHAQLIPNRFRYEAAGDEPLLIRLTRYCAFRRGSRSTTSGIGWLRWFGWLIPELVGRLLVIVWAIFKFDVFIFTSETSLLHNYWDLPPLRWLGKRIILVMHGSDCRPPYINGAFALGDQAYSTEKIIAFARKKRHLAARAERYAHHIVAIKPIHHYFTKPLIDFSRIGLPRVPNGAQIVIPTARTDADVVRIVHAPSRPHSKGTYEIRLMIERLRQKGYAIEWVELIDKSNQEVWAELAACDLVLDQLYTDNFLGGLGAEAAVLGKPCVFGTYALPVLMADFPPEQVPPAFAVHPDAVEQTVEQVIGDRALREQVGAQAKVFMEAHWSPEAVAARMLRLVEGDFPADWLYDPAKVSYLHGHGIPAHQARASVRRVIEAGGRAALQLAHRPTLEQQFVDFAGADSP